MKPHWLFGLALLPVGYVARKVRKDPNFGANAGAMKYVRQQGVSWKMGSFRNLDKTPIQEGFSQLLGDLYGYLKAKNTQPVEALPVGVSTASVPPDPERDYLTWYGHSALRLETGGKTILLDPMLGEWVAPVPFLGHRFPYKNYDPLAGVDKIDLVIYSHDHYDHLDYDTLMAIKDRTEAYLVPLGVGAHLRSWGVPEEKITELDWWQSADLAGCRFTATPARHFSGRSPRTRNKSLWCGFAIETRLHRLYFGGDSGYGSHYPMIGKKLGGFDLTMLDSGQYHKRWKNIHMQPEEALRAHQDIEGRALLPIHWGAFSLSDHPWYDPIDRITKADEMDCVVSPLIGQRFDLAKTSEFQEKWWLAYEGN